VVIPVVPKSRKTDNPFYHLLIVVGVLFAITSCAYFFMTLHDADPKLNAATQNHPLLLFLEKHGVTALVIELAVLSLATFGAIGTDDYWERRRRKQLAQDNGNNESQSRD
jgi:hypothetical protein